MRRRAAAVLFCGALAATFAGPARADGPVYLDELQPKPDRAALESFSGWSELLVRGSRTATGDYDLNETIFAPGLHLRTQGGLYERRLLTFRGAATLSLQHRSVSGDVERTDDLSFEDYSAGADLLPQKPLRIRLTADRNHGWHASPFKSSTRTRSTVWGAGADLDWAPLPFSLTWTREEYLEEDFTLDRITERDRLRFGVRRQVGPVRSSLTLRHERFEKNLQPQEYRSEGADLRMDWRPHRTGGIGGAVHWLHRYGSRRHTDLSTRMRGRWELAPDLETRGEVSWRRLRPGGPDVPTTESASGDLSLRHLLWGSLESSLAVHRLDETRRLDDTEVGQLQRTGGRAGLDYRRRLAAGTLHLGVGHDLSRQERTGQDTERSIANEEHVLPELAEIRLEQPDVVPGSVIVTDETGFVVYDENIDYEVTDTAGFSWLRRIPTGAIAADQRILVDYRVTLSSDLTHDTNTWRTNFRFDARRDWSVWLRRENSDLELVSGTPDASLQDRTRTTGGGLLRRGAWTLTDEVENQRVGETRFRTNRMQLSAQLRPHPRWRTSLSAGHTWSRTRWPERSQKTISLSARAAWAGTGGATASLESWWRRNTHETGPELTELSDDSLAGGRLRFQQRWRALVFDAQVALHLADRNEIDDRRLVFRTGLRRLF